MHHVLGGKSYGPVEINFEQNNESLLFRGLETKINAWSSHGDSVKNAPDGFLITATSKAGKVIEAMEAVDKKLWGVQFHPEVEQTEDDNIILNNFVEKICECVRDYSKKDLIKNIEENTKKVLGNGIAIIGVSGGVANILS